VRHLLAAMGIETERLALEWASAAEAVRFVALIKNFTEKIKELGPLEPDESTMIKIRAARAVLESTRVRMALARQVRSVRKEKPIPARPSDDEIALDLDNVVTKEMAVKELAIHLESGPLALEECAKRLNRPQEEVLEIFSRLTKRKLVEPDRLVMPDEVLSNAQQV
jgi:hypothetical protein